VFAEPFQTPYDLRFVLFGFPIRVQVLFWLIAIVIGATLSHDAGIILLIVVAVFASILVHELGHAIAMRRYGMDSHIVLYWMGGLAIPGSQVRSSWDISYRQPPRQTHLQQIIICLAGPGAGFLLAGLIILLIKGTGGKFIFLTPQQVWELHSFPLFWDFELAGKSNPALYQLVFAMLQFNILWGLINLLPVFPLDGGQISRELFLMNDRYEGVSKSLMTSMIIGGIIGAAGFWSGNTFAGFLFLSLSFSSYMAWQQTRHGGGRQW
jgi:stage IV sporulation protein FB